MMVDARMAEDAERRAAAALRIGDAPDDRRGTRQHDAARAHRTRLLRDVEPRAHEPPVADGLKRRAHRQHLRVRCRVLEPLRHVVRPAEDPRRRRIAVVDGRVSVMRRLDHRRRDNDAPRRHLAVRRRLLRLAKRHAHEVLVKSLPHLPIPFHPLTFQPSTF